MLWAAKPPPQKKPSVRGCFGHEQACMIAFFFPSENQKERLYMLTHYYDMGRMMCVHFGRMRVHECKFECKEIACMYMY